MLAYLSSCKKDEPSDLYFGLIGMWVNTQVDQQNVLTDNAFVMIFLTNKVEIYARGFNFNDSNKTWIENDKYYFSVQDSSIVIDGSDQASNDFYIVFNVNSIDDQSIIYTVSEFKINGVNYPDPKTYTCRRITADIEDQFIGTWYGKSTTPGTSDTTHHYWDYFADGSFNYYYRDTLGNWINKPDNAGRYFLYGDFLATNYTNDLLSDTVGKAYECWNISIEGTTMYYSGLRQNGQTASFELTRVEGPPTSKSLRMP
jgi:hypothetical protein